MPADGILLSAQAHINTAVLTGESYPQQVIAGQPVYAGCQVVSEQVEMTVSEMGHRTRVGQILEKIESELKNKTPLTSLVDKVAQYFTIIVLAAGFLFFVGYSFVDANEAVRRALALVILACPCALAFATPLTQSLSLIKAAKNSYLIKNAAVLEKLSRIKLVAFDKTGTLTRGEFKFLCWDYGEPSLEQQQIIHQLEASSQHPIALALKKELAPFVQSLPAIALEDWQEIEGRGVFATIKSRRYSMQAAPSRIRQRREFDFFVTRVGLYADDQLVCVAVLGDEPKADAVRTLRHIEELGATPMILSGDAKEAVLGLAKELSLSARQALADMSPEAKHQWVKDHPQTLMVGDGANDSLALASADVSVAVQGSMESSLEAADIYLATGGVTPIWHLIKLGQDTMHVVRRNLYISIVYNLIGGISALLGLINPLVAAVLMPISSAIVVMSSLYGTYFLRRLSRKGSYWQSNSLPTQEMGRHREQLA
ncbi:MAG: HAD-IC family P-type ATPase [Bdellovibrionales bacterium]|nr:HAD-IC family P-type ATPase [Bdellovibrionales bacterium]